MNTILRLEADPFCPSEWESAPPPTPPQRESVIL